jgi:predicted outer membrane repeat protein
MLKRVTAGLVLLFFLAVSKVGAYDVNDFNDFSDAISASTNIVTFTNGNILYTGSLGNISWKIDFYGGTTLDGAVVGSANNSLLTIRGGEAHFHDDINFINGNGGLTYPGGYSGGAIENSYGSILTFADSKITFKSNSMMFHGAIYNSNSTIIFTNSAVDFINNNASGASGGAISISGGSLTFFHDSTVTFNGNRSNDLGGAIAQSSGTMNFIDSTVSFTSNVAGMSGGAISNDNGSMLTFEDSKITFKSNSARITGAINNQNSTIIFTNSAVDFIENMGGSTAKGGGIWNNNGSMLIFEGSTVTFNSNSNMMNGSGGAIAQTGSTMNFTDSTVNFTNNAALELGGAISNDNGSILTFADSKITFKSNSAGVGGAVLNDNDSMLIFEGSTVMFNGNTSNDLGGAIVQSGGTMNCADSTVSFISNVATNSGGAIEVRAGKLSIKNSVVLFLNNESSNGGAICAIGDIDIKNSIVKFVGNKAGYGGALYMPNDGNIKIKNVIFSGNEALYDGGAAWFGMGGLQGVIFEDAEFKNNSAQRDGGAMFLNSSKGISVKASDQDIVFSGNTDGSGANDIYLNGTAELELRAESGRAIRIGGGIKGETVAIVRKTGGGKIELESSSVNEYYGEFKIEEGSVEVKEDINILIGSLDIGIGGRYSLKNEEARNVTVTGETTIRGAIEIDIDLGLQVADILVAEPNVNSGGGKIYIEDGARLGINVLGVNIGESRIKILEGAGGITGMFGNDPFEALGYGRSIGGRNYVLEYFYDHVDIVKLAGTDFRNTFNYLTHNQKEVAVSVDRISAGMGYGSGIRSEFLETIEKVEILGSEAEKKRALDELAGSVIANAISAGAYGYGDEEIFERLQRREAEGARELSKSVWGQGLVYGRESEADENSVEEFSVSGYAIEAGADIISGESLVGGIYGGWDRGLGKQGKNKAEIEQGGIGIYGGWFGENIDVKGRVYGGKVKYAINRRLEILEEESKNDIEGYNVKGDIMGQYNIRIGEKIRVRPYIGVKSGYVIYSESKGEGRSGAGVEIYDGSYMRAEGNIGVGVNYEAGKVILYGKAGGGYIIAGEKATYEGEFIDSGEKMDIWGAQSGKISGLAAAGGEYEVTDRWSVYGNIGFGYAQRLKGYYGTFGVKYRFSKGGEEAVLEKERKELSKIIEEKDIEKVWETAGDKSGRIVIGKETERETGIGGQGEAYLVKYGGRIFFFKERATAEAFVKKIGAGKKAIKESRVIDGNIYFERYKKELGDMREGLLIVKYANSINEIKAIPEEAKKAHRDAVISEALDESKANIICEVPEESGSIRISSEIGHRLGLKKGGKIYMFSYGKRIFLFKERGDAEGFIEKLEAAGAKVEIEDIREIEGVEIKEDIAIKASELKDIGDMSKGVLLEHYEKEGVTEVKSVAEEEKRAKEERITREKIEKGKERREKPMIKKYRLNVANFAINEYSLRKEAKKIIEEEAKEIRKYEYKMITVEGHSDNVGDKEVNERISRKRAESVYREFLLNGIPTGKIGFIGYGFEFPMESNASKEGRAANRRTEIYVE